MLGVQNSTGGTERCRRPPSSRLRVRGAMLHYVGDASPQAERDRGFVRSDRVGGPAAPLLLRRSLLGRSSVTPRQADATSHIPLPPFEDVEASADALEASAPPLQLLFYAPPRLCQRSKACRACRNARQERGRGDLPLSQMPLLGVASIIGRGRRGIGR